MRFWKKWKISPHYTSLYQVVKRIVNFSYELDLPASLSLIYIIFHMSMPKKCVADPSLIVPLEDDAVMD